MSARLTAFRELHTKAEPLKLPNAWDAGSARVFESLGATAIATTSAGVAWAQGYGDGRQMPRDVAFAAAMSMRRVVEVPLTVDIEHGYSDDPKDVAEFVVRLADSGVDGINLEDGPDEPTKLAKKIEAIKSALSNRGLDIFVNARTDVFLAALVDPPKMVEETLSRGTTYRSAGADGLFVPALSGQDQIIAIVKGAALPLNVMAVPKLADAKRLGSLGVKRVSAGSGIAGDLGDRVESGQMVLGRRQLGRSDKCDGLRRSPGAVRLRRRLAVQA